MVGCYRSSSSSSSSSSAVVPAAALLVVKRRMALCTSPGNNVNNVPGLQTLNLAAGNSQLLTNFVRLAPALVLAGTAHPFIIIIRAGKTEHFNI